MNKTLQVAVREFLSTVGTKGFIVGTLIFPAIMIIAIILIPRLLTDESPRYVGTVAIVDRTDWTNAQGMPIADLLAQRYTPEGLEAEREAIETQVRAQVGERARELGGERAGEIADDMAEKTVDQMQDPSEIEIVALPADVNLEAEKQKLWESTAFDGGRLALIVIDEHAVSPSEEGYGAYQSFVRAKIDDRFQDPLRRRLNEVLTGARIEEADYDAAKIGAMYNIKPPKPVEVTEEGERDRTGNEGNVLIAAGFMMLLWISVMSGGQYLMTTVITEKSNRVMEVLLSAVSPTQLMTGKILGQMCVALAILGIYITMGMVALDQFDKLHLIETSDLALMVVYFFIAFFFFAAAMAAIGSAVTEIMEANALFTPVIMVLIIPWLMFMPLSQNPNSTFATVIGLIPPISPFAMVIRESGTDPIPVWQHVAAIAIGIAAVFFAIWATAKIFRIGVLMYGKPPNFRTLIKWVRMA